jgi:hypothetical protein
MVVIVMVSGGKPFAALVHTKRETEGERERKRERDTHTQREREQDVYKCKAVVPHDCVYREASLMISRTHMDKQVSSPWRLRFVLEIVHVWTLSCPAASYFFHVYH